jgi:manganese/zinc/iron transport system substrate-binding protein
MTAKNLMAGLVVALVTIGALTGCGGGGARTETEVGALRVVATTTIVADLVRIIGGPDVELESLMGPGVDPHLYKPSAGDVRLMSRAQAVFYNGLHLEGKMSEVLAEMGTRGVPTVAVAECIPPTELIEVEGFSGVYDPHVWFDVMLWQRAAVCVRDALVEMVPEKQEIIRARAGAYQSELLALDRWVGERLASVPEELRVLVTAHDAFSYFGRAYGVEVRGLLGISTSAEAGTSDVQALAEFIGARRIPAIFVESSVPPRYVEALQQAVAARGFEVAIGGSLYSDALGNQDGPAASYVGTVRANVETIVGALATGGDPE